MCTLINRLEKEINAVSKINRTVSIKKAIKDGKRCNIPAEREKLKKLSKENIVRTNI